MIKKTLLAVAISATFFSLEASANNTSRVNSATSETTQASVGFRPVQEKNAKDEPLVNVSGELTVGSTLTLNGIQYSDSDGDVVDISTWADDIKWYIVDNETADPSGTPGTGLTFTIPDGANNKKIKLVYTLKTTSGFPAIAKEQSIVLLKTDTTNGSNGGSGGGVTGGGAADGTIGQKLSALKILVKNPSGDPDFDHNGVDITNPDKANIPVVGATLEADITCSASVTNCDSSGYRFQWSIADDVKGPYTAIATDAQNQTYIVQKDQQGKFFQVHVSPITKADTPVTKTKRR